MQKRSYDVEERTFTLTGRNLLSRCKLANRMKEIIFVVEEAPEGGFTAQALGASIFTEADDPKDLENQVRDSVRCHFEEHERPKIIRLHFVREEVLAV